MKMLKYTGVVALSTVVLSVTGCSSKDGKNISNNLGGAMEGYGYGDGYVNNWVDDDYTTDMDRYYGSDYGYGGTNGYGNNYGYGSTNGYGNNYAANGYTTDYSMNYGNDYGVGNKPVYGSQAYYDSIENINGTENQASITGEAGTTTDMGTNLTAMR